MSAEMIPFMFKDNAVRTVEINGDPWFVGKDVCRVLDIKDHNQALARLQDDERGGYSVPTPMGEQTAIIVSEAGLYRLIFASRKAEAEEFKRWLAHDVLPQIRKTGRYAPKADPDTFPMPGDDRALALRNWQLDVVKTIHRLDGAASARLMMRHLGLPTPPKWAREQALRDGGRECLVHFLSSAGPNSRRWGRTVELALSAEDYGASLELAAFGVRVTDDGAGLLFANRHDTLRLVFAGTPWADCRWNTALQSLPGAHPVGVLRFAGAASRATFVPAQLVLDAAIAADPR
jgi:hypothetical protein